MMTIDQAAKKFPIGSKVRYFPVRGNVHNFHDGEVRSPPWELGCGHVVLSITGKSGGLSVMHLTTMETSQDG